MSIPPSVAEYAVEERQFLLDTIEEQAREIERLKAAFNSTEELRVKWTSRALELSDEAFMAQQPSGVVLPDDWEESLNTALVLETERAIKQRDEFLRSGVVTAGNGGSHDTCFSAIVRQHIKRLISSPVSAGAALEDAAQSLETISSLAGRDDFMSNFVEVRSYARSRADVARAALTASAPNHSEQVREPSAQWWLAKLDRYGNPTLTDGMHPDRAGANRAFYLHGAFGFTKGERYAVAKVELFEPVADSAGVNHEAVEIVQELLAAAPAPGNKQGGE